MADFEIKNNNIKLVKKELEARILKALTECGMKAESYAKENLTRQGAVDTGLLRNSITFALKDAKPNISSYSADVGGKRGEYSGTFEEGDLPCVALGTNVEYAPYIEYGTGKSSTAGGRKTTWSYKKDEETKFSNGMPARPYLKPALSEHQEMYRKIIKANLSK